MLCNDNHITLMTHTNTKKANANTRRGMTTKDTPPVWYNFLFVECGLLCPMH